jgi:hypothetical protein
LFAPLALADDERQNRGGHFLDVIGRLKPGVSLEQAQADMDVIASNLGTTIPGRQTRMDRGRSANAGDNRWRRATGFDSVGFGRSLSCC